MGTAGMGSPGVRKVKEKTRLNTDQLILAVQKRYAEFWGCEHKVCPKKAVNFKGPGTAKSHHQTTTSTRLSKKGGKDNQSHEHRHGSQQGEERGTGLFANALPTIDNCQPRRKKKKKRWAKPLQEGDQKRQLKFRPQGETTAER